MAGMKKVKPLSSRAVHLFKIRNRRGYAALCFMNLTEGSSPLQAYQRMQKAVKRMGLLLPDMTSEQVKKMVE